MPSSHPPTVLVADASPVARMVVARALGEAALVREAKSLDHACASLDAEVALVVTALQLPGGTGQTLAQRIRDMPAHARTPILVVSGNTREALVNQALVDHVTDYFDKNDGMAALRMFFKGYLEPKAPLDGHVLYVEDSQVIAGLMKRAMERRGLAVTHCSHGADATVWLEHARAQGRPVDLVLCDYQLGTTTGLEVVREIRTASAPWSSLPLIVTLAEDQQDIRRALLEGGAHDLLTKPAREEVLMAKIGYHLWRAKNQPESNRLAPSGVNDLPPTGESRVVMA